MSGNDKAPGWSVRRLDFRAGPRWCVYDEPRLVCWAEIEADATRIVEAVNGLAEAREDAAEVLVWRDHAGAIDDALGGYSLTLSRVQAVQAVVRERDYHRDGAAGLRAHLDDIDKALGDLPGGTDRCEAIASLRAQLDAAIKARDVQARLKNELVEYGREVADALGCGRPSVGGPFIGRLEAAKALVRERDEARSERDHVIRQRNEALASLGAVRCERDELRAQAPQAAPSTLAALEAAAARLTATIERHEELLGIAPEPDEIAKLRKVAMAVADWLKAENSKPLGCGQCEEAYRVWHELQIEIAPALGLDEPHWPAVDAALRALAGGAR